MEMSNVKLIEVCTTWQGEGPDTGKRMMLVRFKRCNRTCQWCDTQIRMRNLMESDYCFNQLQTTLDDNKSALLISGGEPSFGLNLNQTVALLNELVYPVANVETNGLDLVKLISRVKQDKNIKYMLSPKLFTKDDTAFYIKLVDEIKDNEKVFIKLVCEPTENINIFLDYLNQIDFSASRVYLMPEGTTREDLIKHSPFVFDMCEKYNFNFSSRSHIIYGFI